MYGRYQSGGEFVKKFERVCNAIESYVGRGRKLVEAIKCTDLEMEKRSSGNLFTFFTNILIPFYPKDAKKEGRREEGRKEG